MKTNCPNCGAPIDPYLIKCPYCGTIYFNFAALDCEMNKPVFIKFKTKYEDTSIAITALAMPSLETVEVNSNSSEVRDCNGNCIASFTTSKTCDMIARFRCIENEGNLFSIEKE